MSERKKPIPVPPGGFKSHEDEARWLADTIAMRAGEAVAAVIGISATFSADSLYDLLLMGLQSAGKRSAAEAQEAILRDAREKLDEMLEVEINSNTTEPGQQYSREYKRKYVVIDEFGGRDIAILEALIARIDAALAPLDRQGGSPNG